MNWKNIWDKTKQAASKTVDGINAINEKFDEAEVYMFGEPLDAKLDVLYDEYGEIVATKAKTAKEWTYTNGSKAHQYAVHQFHRAGTITQQQYTNLKNKLNKED